MSKFFRILSIDGGGIRGIIPARILMTLEEKLQTVTNDPDKRLSDFFDLIAGTSTGGILTCIYLFPDSEDPQRSGFNAQAALEIYLNRGHEIFHIPVWQKVKSGAGILDEKHRLDGLEAALNDYLQDRKLSELIKPCLITSYNIERRAAFFFTQHDARQDASRDFLLRDVARATSAAPTFFECADVKSATQVSYPMIDGGVFANNPALCAYAEARTMEDAQKPTAKQMVILSLGTGAVKTPYHFDAAKDWGAVQWIRPVLDIIMSGVAETVDYQLKRIFDAAEATEQYLRIQPQLPPERADMDNAKPTNLEALHEIGRKMADDNDERLDAFVQLLVAS